VVLHQDLGLPGLAARRQRLGSRSCASSGGDINNPHTLVLRAKEAFFLDDGVILVEGQEDVMGYERLFSGFLGSGRRVLWVRHGRGPEDATHRADAHELGFERVMGILDSDNVAVAGELRTRFPKYGLQLIPTRDIRDKDEVAARPARATLKGASAGCGRAPSRCV
jgi:hypothetical protein